MSYPPPEIILQSALRHPFGIQAAIIEEDTALVLSAKIQINIAYEHPISVMTALHDQRSVKPGRILIKNKSPHSWYAIVHDFDQSPSLQTGWISSALNHALEICVANNICDIATQLLGCTYESRPDSWFLNLLQETVENHQSRYPQRILLLDQP